MPIKGWRKPRPGDPTDPEGFRHRLAQFVTWMETVHYAAATVRMRMRQLDPFVEWCDARGLTRPTQLTRSLLERYQRHVALYRTAAGPPLALQSQQHRLTSVRVFCKWLARQHVLLSNPAAELQLPRMGRPLPKAILSETDVELILSRCDVTTPLGLRDRAILETFYSTGIRRTELLGLSLTDVDRERGLLRVRHGKGRTERYVPIGNRALAWLDKYLLDVRPQWVNDPALDALFVLHQGHAMTPAQLSARVRSYVQQSGLGKPGACHLFRHSCATAMLEHGADLRSLQELLGHAKLSTTQLYTRISIRHLKDVHTRTHPTAQLTRRVPDVDQPSEASSTETDALITSPAPEEARP
jgi:integrase/recombinase XerD